MTKELEANTTISHYRIVTKIGAGGMGEVYEAHDSRLDREVAIKVLPADYTSDADRLKRFEQEAKATSALNHPNILTVFDIGEFENSPFIVSELLKGEELRGVLNEHSIPIRKVISYAQQIVSGLTAAHEKHIVHRDLKPENIFITTDERVKILDFGIAKLTEPKNTANSEDATRRALTDPGMVMGTVGYMSPEQVRGQVTDHRSDIFSFGLILYEMIRGEKAFQRETLAETMTAILKEEPDDLADTNPGLDPSLERIVRRCLEKKPEHRFQSTADLSFALDSLSAPRTSSGSNLTSAVLPLETEKVKSGILSRVPIILGGLALLALGLVAGFFAYGRLRPVTPPSYQQLTFRRGLVSHARFSPDGQTFIYSAAWNGQPLEIFSTRAGLNESQPLGLKDADLLDVSSSGELAVLVKRKFLGQMIYRGTLARVPMIGGTPREVAEDIQEADWSPDGKDLAVVRYVDGKNRLEYPVGKVLYETEGYISYPRISPKGDRIAFMDHSQLYDNRGTITAVDLSGNKVVFTDEFSGEEGLAWSPSGDEVWFTGSKTGESSRLYGASGPGKIREVLSTPADLWIHDVASDGRVLLTRFKQTTDITGSGAGDERERDLSTLDYGGVSDISRDGRSFVYTHWGEGSGADYSIYLCKTDGSPPVRLGEGAGEKISPDGKWVISFIPSSEQIVLLPTGAGEIRRLNKPSGLVITGRIGWFPDGKQLLFTAHESGHRDRAFAQDVNTGTVRPITPEGTTGALVSPDGRSFFCVDNDRASICSVDENSPPKPILGYDPSDLVGGWTADGRSLFVRPDEPTLKVFRLDIASGHKEPFKEIIPADMAGMFSHPSILLTPDGKGYIYSVRRYLMDLYLADGLK